MIGVGLASTLSGGKKIRTNLDPMPALDLNFAANRSLPADYGPTPSFSRASSGTYFDSSGTLRTAATNVARFDHVLSGGSWVSKGLLVEEQRTNSVLQSENPSSASWTKVRLSISSNVANAPDGATTADKLVEDSANAIHYLRQTFSGISSGSVVAFSGYFKAGERQYIVLIGSDNVAKNYPVLFDLANGTVLGNLTSWAAYAAPLSSSIINVGNGWYRCVVVAQLDAGVTTASITTTLSNTSSLSFTGSYAGDGSSGIYQWGAQVEVGSFATSYIPTTSASATRSADVCQITGSDFSSFWNATEGTIAVEYDRIINTGTRPLYSIYDSAESTNLIYQFPSGGNESCEVWVSNSPQCQLAIGSTPANGVSGKSAFAFKQNDFAGSLNGAAVVTDTSGNLTVCTQMKIGYATTNWLNGHIARLRYYPTRLTNAKLQELST